MPPKAANKSKAAAPLFLITGDDDFAVKGRARQLFQEWSQDAGGFDNEIIDATASNSSEALNTLLFFGGAKVIWFQNCNFLGEERAASSQAVTEVLAQLSDEIKSFRW